MGGGKKGSKTGEASQSQTSQSETRQPASPSTSTSTQPSEMNGKKKKKTPTAEQTGAVVASSSAEASSSKQEAKKSGNKKVKDTSTALAAEVDKKLSLDTPSFIIPKRNMTRQHSEKTCLKKIRIEVNYLPITIKSWDLKIYHYDVTFNPEKPKSLFRRALHLIQQKYYPKRHPAFDGKKNLYAAGSSLPFPRDNLLEDSIELPDPEDGMLVKSFFISIKLVSKALEMKQMAKYMENGSSQNIPQDVIQATDIALRARLFENFIPCGRSFFSGPANVDLSGGLELYNGFFQSAIAAKQCFLNVDVSNKAFPQGRTVLEYLTQTIGVQDNELKTGLSDSAKRDLQNYIKGLKVTYAPQGERRTYKVNGLGIDSIRHKFEIEGKGEINVAEYFRRHKRIELKYPHLPLLHVGPPQKNTMVPLEFCKIIGNQVVMRKLDDKQTSQMVRAAATSTDIRKQRIMDNIRNAKYHESDILTKEFGITIDTKFAQVDSCVFKPPDIQYKQGTITPVNGCWRMDRQAFKSTSSNGIDRWAILIKDSRTPEDGIRNGLVKLFISCGKQMGLHVAEPKYILTASGSRDQTEAAILNNLTTLNTKYGPLQIVLVIMPGGGAGASQVYNNIKRASELRCGVLTQCLKQITATRKMNHMTMQNILLKMNTKINGVNHELGGPLKPALFKTSFMFVGADVTHPVPGTSNSPSIAAVAASFDPAGFKYKMMYQLQGSRKEMIEDLEEIMVTQLKYFKKVNGTLPKKILYYRDGVSEGQFSHVLNIELKAMRQACRNKDFGEYRPGITFLVVQKRHHTRFFPQKQDGDNSKNNNVLPGTVVDTLITHPTEMDFYLVSHQSIQGTARPTKYHVLWDDNRFDGEDLEMLTYYLCYLFSRCNRSVSYPAPTYYAHLGAFRARAYWEGQKIDFTQLKQEQLTKGTIKEAICSETPMFFV